MITNSVRIKINAGCIIYTQERPHFIAIVSLLMSILYSSPSSFDRAQEKGKEREKAFSLDAPYPY